MWRDETTEWEKGVRAIAASLPHDSVEEFLVIDHLEQFFAEQLLGALRGLLLLPLPVGVVRMLAVDTCASCQWSQTPPRSRRRARGAFVLALSCRWRISTCLPLRVRVGPAHL